MENRFPVRLTALTVALGLLVFSDSSRVQAGQMQPAPPRGASAQPQIRDQQAEVVNRYLFQPRMVLASADEIGLTPQQRAAVEAAVDESRDSYRRARFELANAMTAIAGMAVQHPVDEEQILAQLDRILEIEREIKRGQLLMLIRVKNALTPDQHLVLEEIKVRQFQRGQRQN